MYELDSFEEFNELQHVPFLCHGTEVSTHAFQRTADRRVYCERVSFFFPYKTDVISIYLCSSFFTPVGLTHPQVLDGLFIPVIISVEFAQNHLELCCLENDGLAQVSDAVSCHHHGALIHQGPAADKDPGPFPKAVLLHPAGCAIDGCLPWPPRRGHCLLKGDVFCFSTD